MVLAPAAPWSRRLLWVWHRDVSTFVQIHVLLAADFLPDQTSEVYPCCALCTVCVVLRDVSQAGLSVVGGPILLLLHFPFALPSCSAFWYSPWHTAGRVTGRAVQRLDYCWAVTSFLSRLLKGLMVLGRKFGNIFTLNAAPLVLGAAVACSWRVHSCD